MSTVFDLFYWLYTNRSLTPYNSLDDYEKVLLN